ncbi:MAG: nucleotidyltransferase domain-containing protein [Verrucomicrobiota bacterium]|nr:nucleotidyltransferase domain-containing protein [Verrucomicrobiota bacterium]
MDISDVNIKKIKEVLRNEKIIVAAFLHGSVLTKNFREDSDIDIGILSVSGEKMSLQKKIELSSKLSLITKREIHIGELRHDALVFAKEVIENGQLLFTKDRYYTDMFIAISLSMYAELQQTRKEVIDAYRT